MAHGLRKFDGDRQQRFANFCGLHEIDPDKLTAKRHWLHDELVGRADEIGQKLRAATTAQSHQDNDIRAALYVTEVS